MITFLKSIFPFKHSGKTLIIFVGLNALCLLLFIYIRFIYPSEKMETEILTNLQAFTEEFSKCSHTPSSCVTLMCPGTNSEKNLEGFVQSIKDTQTKYGQRMSCSVDPSSILVQSIFSKKSDFDFQCYFQCKTTYQNTESIKNIVLENWLVLVKNLNAKKELCLYSLKSQ